MISHVRTLFPFLSAAALLGASVAPVRASAETKPATDSESFSFAFISDTHIVTTDTTAKFGDRTVRLQKALHILNARKDIDFIIHGGDMIDSAGSVEQFNAFDAVMKTRLPWYPIPGNHDINNIPTLETIHLWNSRGYGRGPHHRDFYGFVHKNAAFFILNTFSCDSKDPRVIAQADEQLREMDAFFTAHADLPHKIVCGHAPLFLRSPDEPDEYFNIPKAYRKRILDVMKRHGVHTYLCGHRHGDYTVHGSDGVTVMTQTTLAYPIGEGQRTGFSIFTVSKDGIRKKFIPVVDAIPSKTGPAAPSSSSADTPSTPTSADAPESFLILGDTHYDLLSDHNMEWLRQKPGDLRQVTREYTVFTKTNFPRLMHRLLAQSKAIAPPVRALVQLGDLQEGLAGSPDRARQMTRHVLEAITAPGFPVPWILVKGNHDITGPGAAEAYQEIVVPFLRKELKTPITKPYYTWTSGDLEFFCLDSYDPAGLLPFLETELPKSTARYKIVALHQPVVPVTGRCWHVLNRPEDAATRKRLLALLGHYHVIVLCGHLHRFSVLRRETPQGPFVQVSLCSVIRDPDRDTPYQSTTGYGPALIDLEPRFSPATKEKRSRILADEAPFVKDFCMEDLPGYGVLTLPGGKGHCTLRVFPNTLDKPYKEVDLTELFAAAQVPAPR